MSFELEVPALGIALNELIEPVPCGISIETLFDQAGRHRFAPICKISLLAIFQPVTNHQI